MKVNEAAARRLLVAMGYKNAGDVKAWSAKRLVQRLNDLPRLLEDASEPADEEARNLLRSVSAALEAGESVALEGADVLPPAAAVKARKEGAVAKNGKTKPGKAKPGKTAPERGPSAKERVYREWAKAKDKSPQRAEDYQKKVGGSVKLTTIKSWVGAWGRGQNLPACAK